MFEVRVIDHRPACAKRAQVVAVDLTREEAILTALNFASGFARAVEGSHVDPGDAAGGSILVLRELTVLAELVIETDSRTSDGDEQDQ